jgi:hypothetical protein
MFLAHLKWRAEFGADTILHDFDFQERDAFLTLYPQGYHKTDRLGRPVYIQHLGQIDMRALNGVTNEDRMLRYHVQEYERALRYIFPACAAAAGCHVSTTLAVMDLKGVGLRHMSGEVKRILTAVTRTDQDNYPETLGKTLIINAPGVFRAIWAVVKPMLDARTQAKIEVCPADFLKVLTKWVDPASIPAYLGGTSQGSLIDDVGPWDDPAVVAAIDADIARRDAGLPPVGPLAERASATSAGGAVGEGAAPPARTVEPGPGAARRSESAAAEPLLPARHPSSGSPAAAAAAAAAAGGGGADSGAEGDVSEEDEFHDALTRRASSMSAASSACEQRAPALPRPAAACVRAGTTRCPLPAPDRGSPVHTLPSSLTCRHVGRGGRGRVRQRAHAARARRHQPRGRAIRPAPDAPARERRARQRRQRRRGIRGGLPQGAQRFCCWLAWLHPRLRCTARRSLPPACPTLLQGLGRGASWDRKAGAPPCSSSSAPIPIMARVRALEERLPAVAGRLRAHPHLHLPPGAAPPSAGVGQGTLVGRVAALERAMEAVLAAQGAALDERQGAAAGGGGGRRGCCPCCAVM